MALAAKNEELKRVPWLSLGEWRRVYEDVYSNDTALQTRGYETLLVWKGRMPKLPVGVDCTLSLLQVCLRDRELSPKINQGAVPLYYENDLCLMYSTVIMRFLNQISNVGHTKQTSLFQIAKQLNIPDWIVNLRHDAAHGHDLPSLSLLRMATNILLAWLHDEYWRAEAESLESSLTQNDIQETKETENLDNLIDLIELWVSVGLYIAADFAFVADLPDENLRATLKDLYSLQKSKKRDLNSSLDDLESSYRLTTARSHLLTEISTEIRQKNVDTVVLTDFLVNNEAFFPSSEFLQLFSRASDESLSDLPKKLASFWQPLIGVLLEVRFLDVLVEKLVEIASSGKEKRNRRTFAALWLRSIGQGLLKLKIAQKEGQVFEHSQKKNKKTPQKVMNQKVQEKVNKKRPDFRNSLWFPMTSEVPRSFTSDEFVSDVVLHADEFTLVFVEFFMDLVEPEMDFEKRNSILEFLKIQSVEILDNEEREDVIRTVEDLKSACGEEIGMEIGESAGNEEIEGKSELFDKKIRNLTWEIASADAAWENTPFGVLPWQIANLETLQVEGRTPEVVPWSGEAEIVPGFVDKEKVLKGRRVNWDNVLRKSLRGKRKKNRAADVVMDRAMRIVKTRKM